MTLFYNNAYNAIRTQNQMLRKGQLVFACDRNGISSFEEPPYAQWI